MQARLVDTALSSSEIFSSDQSPSGSLTTSEFKAIMHLPNTKILYSIKQIKVTPLRY